MNAESSGFPSPRAEAERLNDKGVEAVQELLYVKTVDLIYDGIALHLAADKAADETMNDSPGFIGAFVQHDVLTAPMQEGDRAVSTFCTRLEPDSPDDEGIKYLEIHIPSGDANIGAFEMPPQRDVNDAYIKVGFEKRSFWYAFNKKLGMYQYVPAAETADETDEYMVDVRGAWQAVEERISEQSSTAMQLFRRIVNWRTVPQSASGTVVVDVPDLPEME